MPAATLAPRQSKVLERAWKAGPSGATTYWVSLSTGLTTRQVYTTLRSLQRLGRVERVEHERHYYPVWRVPAPAGGTRG